MVNIPKIKLGIVAVSRDCFPMQLSKSRVEKVTGECRKLIPDVYLAETVVENEKDAVKALAELEGAQVNALMLYLGNFGPEGPETFIAQEFCGPVMVAAAAEESGNDLIDGRGDAYCGMLNCSYNLALRGVKAYIPECPVGLPDEVAKMAVDFIPIASALLGISKLKIFGFGPRPQDFLACNAPVKPLYDLGAAVMENSELDLFVAFNNHKGDKRIEAVAADMAQELGAGNKHPGVLARLAQYELTLLDFMEENLGYCEYAVFANKCWPAFQTQFGFVPCYVNSRLAARGIPVACETDIYGALSEYILTCVTGSPATLLDINNTVPGDMIGPEEIKPYKAGDLFMGFHCGNTAACLLRSPSMEHQLIMKRALEPDGEPDITRGTIEGAIRAGEVTIFRIQSTAGCEIKSYIAEGEVLDLDPCSFGGIGVFAIPEMRRFYRHVLIEKNYPHHAGIGFKRCGKALYEVMKLLGVGDISYNLPAGAMYPTENPFIR